MEYALESVALFNPSIVPAILQDDVPPGSVRFLMSLRATGEGHISSIVFRTGLIAPDGDVQLEPAGSYSLAAQGHRARRVPQIDSRARYGRHRASPKRNSERFWTVSTGSFTRDQLAQAIAAAPQAQPSSAELEETADTLISLTRVNYQLHLPHKPPVFREVEIVIFPFSDLERHGIEDLRLVRFTEDDGSHIYYRNVHGLRRRSRLSAVVPVRGRRHDRHQPDHRRVRQEQGDGSLPEADQRPIRHDFADRQREPLLHGVRRRPVLGSSPDHPEAASSPGRSSRSATAARPSRPRRAGCS